MGRRPICRDAFSADIGPDTGWPHDDDFGLRVLVDGGENALSAESGSTHAAIRHVVDTPSARSVDDDAAGPDFMGGEWS